MKGRIILILTMALSAVSSVFAEVVPQKQAMQLAQNFFNTMYGTVTGRPKLVWNGRELTTNRLFTPFYTYNSPKGGYVTISADSKAYPVLSYSRVSQSWWQMGHRASRSAGGSACTRTGLR